MCLEVMWKYGIILGTCSGLIIPKNAELWDMDAVDMKRHLCRARRLLPYVHDIALLRWYQDNDGGRMQSPPFDSLADLLEATDRIHDNPWASELIVGFACELKPLLEGWLNPRRHKDKARRRGAQAGYVYLLKGELWYKIGLSKNVYRRWREISPKLPFQVEIVCMIATKDMYKLEASLHEVCADKRVNGEWFELDEADVEYIRGLAE